MKTKHTLRIDGHLYEVDFAEDEVSLTCDRLWLGTGRWSGSEIVDIVWGRGDLPSGSASAVPETSSR